ncbi:MAG TPA: DUF456 domain-containing protein [Cryptosporangiaceae bacterium]|nr:DUF456 domain-containing protein [Cryptosporangiaceae bacterium]
MDISDLGTAVTVLAGIGILVGLLGIVVPVLPGLVLCWVSVLVWAIFADAGWGRWLVLALVTVFVAAGIVVKYAWPGRNLKHSGVPNLSLFAGLVLGIVGFFVVPVLGLPLGFVLGVWLAEAGRMKDFGAAWPPTWAAMKATGLAIMIELAAGMAVAVTWIAGVVFA